MTRRETKLQQFGNAANEHGPAYEKYPQPGQLLGNFNVAAICRPICRGPRQSSEGGANAIANAGAPKRVTLTRLKSGKCRDLEWRRLTKLRRTILRRQHRREPDDNAEYRRA